MLLDVSIAGESLGIEIADPFRLDIEGIHGRVKTFAASKGVRLDGADVRGLIPKLVRGIAGCEGGCPSDAMGLVSRGHKNFRIEYVEGGILVAEAALGCGGAKLVIKMFPEF